MSLTTESLQQKVESIHVKDFIKVSLDTEVQPLLLMLVSHNQFPAHQIMPHQNSRPTDRSQGKRQKEQINL